MEGYTQITLDQWMQWKEDIRRKLGETAGNFVYIGYRLKQIRDSGMYGGAADVFEFAEKEFGLGKSTVSRFIAINEKYSEGGNSLELKEEFRNFSSSKLAEMLTLPDSEIELITEKTTIREIRELKNFIAQEEKEYPQEEIQGKVTFENFPGVIPGTEESREAGQEDPGEPLRMQETEAEEEEDFTETPLGKCLTDFFREKKQVLYDVMRYLGEKEPDYKAAAELIAPSGQTSHKKGLVFLFFYGWEIGVKYRIMGQPKPIPMTWPGLLEVVRCIYQDYQTPGFWENLYGDSVATSQQEGQEERRPQEKTQEKKEEKAGETLKMQGAEPHDAEPRKEGNQSEEEQEESRIPEQEEGPENLEIIPGTGAVEIIAEGGETDGEDTAGTGDDSGEPAAGIQEGSPAAVVTADGDTVEKTDESDGTAESGGREENSGAGSTLTDVEIENMWDEITDHIDDLDDFRREYRWKELDQILALALKEAYHKAVDLAAGLEKLLIARGGNHE